MKVQRSSRIGFRFFAWKATSSSVIGTKPQFLSPAHLRLEVALPHVPDGDPVLGLDLVGHLVDRVSEPVALLQLAQRQPPDQQVDLLPVPERLEPLPVVGRVPGLEDHRVPVVALDEDAALVVGGEVHRPEQPLAASLPHPGLGRVEERGEDRGVAVGLDEAELAVVAALVLVPAPVDLGGDPADRLPLAVAPGEEVLRLGVVEEGVLGAIEESASLGDQWRHPGRTPVEAEGELDEAGQIAPAADRPHLDGHGPDATRCRSAPGAGHTYASRHGRLHG
jgi:hypothetical protein